MNTRNRVLSLCGRSRRDLVHSGILRTWHPGWLREYSSGPGTFFQAGQSYSLYWNSEAEEGTAERMRAERMRTERMRTERMRTERMRTERAVEGIPESMSEGKAVHKRVAERKRLYYP